jgi:hypothetical protein
MCVVQDVLPQQDNSFLISPEMSMNLAASRLVSKLITYYGYSVELTLNTIPYACEVAEQPHSVGISAVLS